MLIVQKFGGSSVGNLERIRSCAQRVLATQRAGHEVVVVVSAMAGETNRLIGLANQLGALERPEEGAARRGRGPYVAREGGGDGDQERELEQVNCTGENGGAALLGGAGRNGGGAEM